MEEARIIFCCDGCGDEMVTGEIFYRIGLRRLCKDCLHAYALEYFSPSMEVVK